MAPADLQQRLAALIEEHDVAGAALGVLHHGDVTAVAAGVTNLSTGVEATSDTERTMQPQRVPVNVYESTGALVIVAPLPAVTPHDVTVSRRPRTPCSRSGRRARCGQQRS